MPVFLEDYYQEVDGKVVISAEQASRFAKGVAGDFNPIHDVDAKRFCVPGDLLFSLALAKYGVSRKTSVQFSGMVGKDKPLLFPEAVDGVVDIQDESGKVYTRLEQSGEVSHDPHLIETLIRKYVMFSGQNFPFIMVPLMEKHGIMFNPKRPLVIYESMSFELDRLDISKPDLALVESTIDVNGKRGDTHFKFAIYDGEETVGFGDKKLIVSGLMPWDAEAMGDMVERFNALKEAYPS
ncbi:DUF3581 family protein [Reinekea blandensis]|uniref:DUF3581 domain-containing protein n=1 Tax=Reinekea blandensis MED297 TaxID=314283 RepID=A4BGT0_9GAMM|nr:hypothetical protein MED297_14470 [Reinekea sp. MED297] [Reinekea blandensis MED297]